jgi:hypothetical protein
LNKRAKINKYWNAKKLSITSFIFTDEAGQSPFPSPTPLAEQSLAGVTNNRLTPKAKRFKIALRT